MATAVRRTIPQPPAPPPVQEIVLTLSTEEARTLVGILSKIGGDPNFTWRKYSGAIADALYRAQVYAEIPLPTQSGASSIYAAGPLPPCV